MNEREPTASEQLKLWYEQDQEPGYIRSVAEQAEVAKAFLDGFNGVTVTDAAKPFREWDAAQRKAAPVASGVLDYFPDALLAVAEVSRVGNEQHNPGEPLHWAKEKSSDEADALLRHLIDRGTIDSDGIRHSAKVAWRGLALLQREIDKEREAQA